LGPDFVVICGDLVHEPDAQSFAAFKAIKSGFEVPCYCVPGNHDVGNKATAESLEVYRETMGEDYFAVQHKGAWFVFVNTSLWKENVEGESEKQDAWLTETLREAAASGGPIFIIGHYPLFRRHAGEWENYFNLPKKARRRLLALYERSHVAAVLTGHTHRLLVNRYKDIQMVCGETTCRNSDKRPLGFRVWTVKKSGPPEHAFVKLNDD
jgi:3',5'-cyclic AMP phosphodiesterase CpdA